MRAKGLFAAGLAAFILGVVGLSIMTPAFATAQASGSWAWGPMGMMGMAGMMGGPIPPGASPMGAESAIAAARNYAASFGNPNLEVDEMMEFGVNYYAQVVEKDTGVHAFELLVDKYTGNTFPEMGPNMVWNTKYGMMGWRLPGQGPTADMPIGPERAQELARQYLRSQNLLLDVGEPERFYGYYTLHTLRDGTIEGMLSVNGYTGDVWYHAWHGPFIREIGLK